MGTPGWPDNNVLFLSRSAVYVEQVSQSPDGKQFEAARPGSLLCAGDTNRAKASSLTGTFDQNTRSVFGARKISVQYKAINLSGTVF